MKLARILRVVGGALHRSPKMMCDRGVVPISIAYGVLCAVALWAAPASSAFGAAGELSPRAGEAIYLHGVLGSGTLLEGAREDGGLRPKGADAACVNCHQRSGLGSVEGRIAIPPVTGQYLFHPRAGRSAAPNLPYVGGERAADREPYTETTLARAIREGLDSEGKPLSYLMPRFAIGDADMAALIDYLKSLDVRRPPGVSGTVLHFATIVTPDADPVKRKGMLDVMEQYFTDKNALRFGPSPPLHTSAKTSYSKSMYVVNRRWQLHVWELTGPASTWQAQLEKRLLNEPVLAVISGLGGSNWEPVHVFCERASLPCLFPNVDVPVDAASDFYPVYLSKGVLLEAELIARRILETKADSVQQIYRTGDSGEPAARALSAELERHGIRVGNRALAASAHDDDLADAVRAGHGAQAMVLWLRPGDLAALRAPPAEATRVFMSGLMGGLERAPLPTEWRVRTQMAYPFDLPETRRARVDYARGWFAIRHIPVVDEQVQVDTYLACGLLSETISRMADMFVRPYLVEQLQTMIAHRVVTGYYPHLNLATGQRFASKGGYVVHFSEPTGSRLAADTDWLVP